MKTTFLVKKNPELPTSPENWIIMDGEQFHVFKNTEEGMRRSKNFIKLCTEYDEECIVAECDYEKLKKWKAEINHAAYVQKMNQEAGYKMVSYDHFETDDTELNGEDLLEDYSIDTESEVMKKLEIEELLEAVEKLDEEDKDLIYHIYLTPYPAMEMEYAAQIGITKQLLLFRKRRAIERLKKILLFS